MTGRGDGAKMLMTRDGVNRMSQIVEDVDIADIAKAVGTPFYCYSRKNLVENFRNFSAIFSSSSNASSNDIFFSVLVILFP